MFSPVLCVSFLLIGKERAISACLGAASLLNYNMLSHFARARLWKRVPLGMGAGTASVCVGALSSAEAKTSLQEEEKSP